MQLPSFPKNSIYVFLFVLVAIVLVNSKHNSFQGGSLRFVDYPKTKPTRCYDCENKTSKDTMYMAGKTKCFDCENHIGNIAGSQNAGVGQATKCLTCGENNILWRDSDIPFKRPIGM